jgi:hypothetical protein
MKKIIRRSLIKSGCKDNPKEFRPCLQRMRKTGKNRKLKKSPSDF